MTQGAILTSNEEYTQEIVRTGKNILVIQRLVFSESLPSVRHYFSSSHALSLLASTVTLTEAFTPILQMGTLGQNGYTNCPRSTAEL